ncbi:hypothetical protein LTR62_007630 [Meristemomyces frigidus]|uniref:Uncharacterized protein n=1 Tax=Meristemomyces frigidus TaxID=1508187 RepID=A0AAN7YDG2_9PEZI|nr:hypothetical protein LTR62_007630 [Meristemomyces frigidus]
MLHTWAHLESATNHKQPLPSQDLNPFGQITMELAQENASMGLFVSGASTTRTSEPPPSVIDCKISPQTADTPGAQAAEAENDVEVVKTIEPAEEPGLEVINMVYLKSVARVVEETQACPILRDHLAEIYGEASQIMVHHESSKGRTNTEKDLQHDLKERRLIIKAIDKRDFRRRAPKKWRDQLLAAKRVLEKHVKEFEAVPELAVTTKDTLVLCHILHRRRSRVVEMQNVMDRADAVVGDFERYLV